MSSSNKMKIINKIENIRLLSKLDLIVNTTSIGFDSWIKKKNKFFNLKFFSPFTKIDNFYLVRNKNKSSFNIKNISMIIKDKNNLNSFFKRNKKMAIFDIIYNPKKTKLLKFAERYRIKTYNGLEMNLMQAVKGFMLVNKIKSLNQVKKKMQK